MSRRIAGLIPFYEYSGDRFFSSDDAPAGVVERRRIGFEQLSALYKQRYPETVRLTEETANGVSDMQFTEAYRVPFQYSRMVRKNLRVGSFLQSSSGVTVLSLIHISEPTRPYA